MKTVPHPHPQWKRIPQALDDDGTIRLQNDAAFRYRQAAQARDVPFKARQAIRFQEYAANSARLARLAMGLEG